MQNRSPFRAVLAMALCAGTLVASEFLPVSLLTPLAADMGVTEGRAGQAVSISGLFAVAASLMITRLGGDRRRAVLGFTALMIASGLVVTLAPNYAVLMSGRALLGVAVGGFWSLSTALVMRLMPEGVPRGLAMLNAGVGVSSILAAPLGAWVGEIAGWRWAFFCLVPLAALALWGQAREMPPMPGHPGPAPWRLLTRPEVQRGMGGIFLFFFGQFAVFTYLRPWAEAHGLSLTQISTAFLGLGLAGLAGTWGVARVLPRSPWAPMLAAPLIMAGVAIAFLVGAGPWALIPWGLVATGVPVGWGTWMARRLGAQAEAAGGLQVAVIQAAIMGGAAVGGLTFDLGGWRAAFLLGAVCLGASSLLAQRTRSFDERS